MADLYPTDAIHKR